MLSKPFILSDLTEGEQRLLRESVQFDPQKDEYTQEFFESLLEPVNTGFSWARDEDGKFLLPEQTLGWYAILWMERWLCHPESSHSEPLQLTPEQKRFLLWWYELTDTGEFKWTRGVLQRCKGWGKDPLAAAISLFEICGPCRFQRWEVDADGNKVPVAFRRANAEVCVAAVNQQQTANTQEMFEPLTPPRTRAQFGLKIGFEQTRAYSGSSKIKMLTGEPYSKDGGRPSLIIVNESHRWVPGTTRGHELHNILTKNARKRDGRVLHITNAYLPGEESVLEHIHDAHSRSLEHTGQSEWLWDSLEGQPRAPIVGPLAGYAIDRVRGDSNWLPVEAIARSLMTTEESIGSLRRMWLNQTIAADDALISRQQWDCMLDRSIQPLRPSDDIVLGFDGSRTMDSTALVAIRISDMSMWVLGLWENPYDGNAWEVDREAVDAQVHQVHRLYNVKGFYGDYELWETYIDDWAKEFSSKYEVRAPGDHPIRWDMRGENKTGEAHERLLTSIYDSKLKWHDADIRLISLRRHALNAVRKETRAGFVSFKKVTKTSRKKVDAYAALMLAHECYVDLTMGRRPTKDEREAGNAFFF